MVHSCPTGDFNKMGFIVLWHREGGKKKLAIESSKSSLLSNGEFVQPIQKKNNWHNSRDWDSFTFSIHHFLCLDKALQKADMHVFLLSADCTGDRMAPRGALMPLVIICDTQLALSLSLESYKQQPEHSREQQGQELISQPSGAGKWCRHHPVVLKPDWSKEPPHANGLLIARSRKQIHWLGLYC